MNSHDKEWWQQQSGEYVLGTLSTEDRLVIETITRTEPEIAAMIVQWQERLQPLSDELQPVEPPEHVWRSIQASIDIDSIVSGNELEPVKNNTSFTPAEPIRPVGVDQLAPLAERSRYRKLNKQVDLWRGFAGLASAVCLLMGLFGWAFFQQQQTNDSTEVVDVVAESPVEENPQKPEQPVSTEPVADTISVVKGASTEALWIVETYKEAGQIKLTSLVPPAVAADKTYQLWMVQSNNEGVVSAGFLSDAPISRQTLELPDSSAPAIAFAVSLEPSGGSPEAGPTGPVLYQGVIRVVSN